MTTFAQLDRARSRHRAIAARALLAVVILAPTAVLFVQAWGNERRTLDNLATERHGVAYIRAVDAAIVAVVDAESTAVAGGTPNLQPVDRAALAIGAVDDKYGAELRTQLLWTDAQNRIQQLHTRTQLAPTDALGAYQDITGMLLSLAEKVRATSGLNRDAHAETGPLQDMAAAQLPDAIVAAGQYADLVALMASGGLSAGGLAAGGLSAGGLSTGTAAASATVQLADLRASVTRDASDVASDLQNASDASPSGAITEATLTSADRFGLAAGALGNIAPSSTAAVSATDVRSAASSAAAVRTSADALASSVLSTVDGLLASRSDDARRTRLLTGAAAILAIIIALVPLMLLAVRRRDGLEGAPVAGAGVRSARGNGTTSGRHGVDGSGGDGFEPVTLGDRSAGRYADGESAFGQPGWLRPELDGTSSDQLPAIRPRPPISAGQERFEEGGPLPRRGQPVPSADNNGHSDVRELMPAGVTHHRRPPVAGDNPSNDRSEDGWGRSGVGR